MDSNEKNLDNSLESAMNMTQEEIERLLAQQEAQSSSEQFSFDDADLTSLLSELGEEKDTDLEEISNLLDRADNNEAVAEDVVALMNRQEAEGENAYDALDLFSGEQSEKKEGFFKRLINNYKNKKKEKQEKKQQQKELKKEQKRQKKQQQEPPEQQQEPVCDTLQAEETVSDSMADAFSLLNGDDIGAIPNKKEATSEAAKENKSEKKKKEKKAKKNQKEKTNAPAELTDEEQISEKSSKKKKDKKGKEEKPKKKKGKEKKNSAEEPIREKKTAEADKEALSVDEQEAPHKKKIIMVFVAAVMIMLGFLVVNYYFTGHANKQLAEESYKAEDYLECYQLMYGQRLNDSQNAMFHRSELILRMDIFWNHYEDFISNNQLLEGIDNLVQFVFEYPDLSKYAAEWNCQDIVEGTYNNVITILEEDYKVNEQTVLDIAALEDDVEYTRALAELVEIKKENDAINQAYPDILPPELDRITQN